MGLQLQPGRRAPGTGGEAAGEAPGGRPQQQGREELGQVEPVAAARLEQAQGAVHGDAQAALRLRLHLEEQAEELEVAQELAQPLGRGAGGVQVEPLGAQQQPLHLGHVVAEQQPLRGEGAQGPQELVLGQVGVEGPLHLAGVEPAPGADAGQQGVAPAGQARGALALPGQRRRVEQLGPQGLGLGLHAEGELRPVQQEPAQPARHLGRHAGRREAGQRLLQVAPAAAAMGVEQAQQSLRGGQQGGVGRIQAARHEALAAPGIGEQVTGKHRGAACAGWFPPPWCPG